MSEEKITVWVTRYALSAGVIEALAPSADVNSLRGFYARTNPTRYIWCSTEGIDWHRTKDRAIARAESMRALKLASLRRQIEKLEAMRFE